MTHPPKHIDPPAPPASYGSLREQVQRVFAKGFLHLFGANLLTQFVGFMSQFAVAWILLPVDIGRIRILQSYIGVAVHAGKAGVDGSILKLCSEARPAAEKLALLRIGLRFMSIASVATLVVMYGLNAVGLLTHDETLRSYFYFFMPILLAMSLADVLMSYVQALKEVKVMARINAVTKVLTLCLIVGLTLLGNAYGYIAAMVIGGFISAGWLALHVRKESRAVAGSRTTADAKLMRSYATFTLAANILAQVTAYLDLFVLNYLVTDRVAVGHYGFALTVLIPFQTIITTVQQIATPYLSEHANNPKEWYRVFWRFNGPMIAGGAILALAAAVVLPPVLHLLFSGKYDPAMPFLLLCLGGWFVRTLYVLQGIGLWGLGKIRTNFWVSLAVFPLNVGLMAFLIRSYGITGAAYGNIATQVVLMVAFTLTFMLIVRKQRAVV